MQNVLTDTEIEKLWTEFEDVLFDEDSNGELILAGDWFQFEKGTSREEIWQWFDASHSKGIWWLLYEFEKEEK